MTTKEFDTWVAAVAELNYRAAFAAELNTRAVRAAKLDELLILLSKEAQAEMAGPAAEHGGIAIALDPALKLGVVVAYGDQPFADLQGFIWSVAQARAARVTTERIE